MQLEEARHLIPRIARGDADALTALYRRWRDRVRALCLRMTGSEADAEDLTQEVFLRVAGRAGTLRDDAAAQTWLFRIARNACVDHLRRVARLGDPGAVELLSDPGASPPDRGRRPQTALLGEALSRLTIEDREVVVLAKCVGLGSEALAEVLDCTAGTARVRLHRALGRLRKLCVELKEESHGM